MQIKNDVKYFRTGSMHQRCCFICRGVVYKLFILVGRKYHKHYLPNQSKHQDYMHNQ